MINSFNLFKNFLIFDLFGLFLYLLLYECTDMNILFIILKNFFRLIDPPKTFIMFSNNIFRFASMFSSLNSMGLLQSQITHYSYSFV